MKLASVLFQQPAAAAAVRKHVQSIRFPPRRNTDGTPREIISASLFTAAPAAGSVPASSSAPGSSSPAFLSANVLAAYKSAAPNVPYTPNSLLRQRRRPLAKEEALIIEAGGAFP